MKDLIEARQSRDDIDRIVDALLENPTRAGDIKTLLRQKMIAPEVVRVAHVTPAEPAAEEIDDFWDNVPV